MWGRPNDQGFSCCGPAVSRWCSGSNVPKPRQGPDIGSEDRHAVRMGMNSPSPCPSCWWFKSLPVARPGRCFRSGSVGSTTILRILRDCTSASKYVRELADIQEAVFAIKECCNATRARWSTPRCPPAMPCARPEATRSPAPYATRGALHKWTALRCTHKQIAAYVPLAPQTWRRRTPAVHNCEK